MLLLGLVALWLWRRQPDEPASVAVPVRVRPVPVAPRREVPVTRSREIPASAPAVPVTNTPPANAADIYRKAIGMIVALTDDEKKVLGDWKATVDPAMAVELCAKLQPIVALAHEAVAVTNCDWGVKNVGVETKLTYLNPARSLARALVWHAAHCREGDATGAGDDLEATLRIGQDSAQFLVGHHVNTAIEAMAIEYLAAHAGAFDAGALERLAKLFGDDQYEKALYKAMEWEAEAVSQTADRFAAMAPEQIQQTLQQLRGVNQFGLMDKAQLVAAVRQVVDLEREYVKAMDLPDAQYQAWLAKLHAMQTANPCVNMWWPTWNAAMDRTRAMVVQRALVVAGLNVLTSGANALQQYPDPASGQPFVYRQTATGFELESAYQQKGKPVVLQFPKP